MSDLTEARIREIVREEIEASKRSSHEPTYRGKPYGSLSAVERQAAERDMAESGVYIWPPLKRPIIRGGDA